MSGRRSVVRALAMFACATVGAACVGTESGNPPAAPTRVLLRSSDPATAQVGASSGAGDVVTEAWVSIEEARLVEGAACDHVAADPALTAVEGDAVAGIETVGLPSASACGLALTLGPPSSAPPGAPDAFDGRAALVRGTRADGVPFEIALEGTFRVDVVTTAPTISVDDTTSFLVTFDAAAWLGAFGLASVPLDADGVARVAPGRGDADLAAFEGAYTHTIELFADGDGDGMLSASEEAVGPLAVSHGP